MQLVRYEPALGLAALFRPLQARCRRPSFRARQSFNGLEYEWAAPEAPGIPEQTLLLALMSLAGPGQQRLAMQPVTPSGHQLRSALAADGELFHGDTASVHTSLSELARKCGYADCGGANLEQMRQMLLRLAGITVCVRATDFEATSKLLSVVISSCGRTRVALNKRLSHAAWGEGQYVSVSMGQRLALSTQTGMSLHAYLSTAIRLGRKHSFMWPRLERAVWGDNAAGSTFRSRKSKLSAALCEIARDGWSIDAQARLVSVSRHSSNKATAKRQQTDAKKGN
ncbi:replication protein C, IncQ-type [Roseateles albus]|uniref:replication protein C, IncQ-type n=1 Tax=Roseateles albus TaxID=2987525 RepID=UPI003964774C